MDSDQMSNTSGFRRTRVVIIIAKPLHGLAHEIYILLLITLSLLTLANSLDSDQDRQKHQF